MAEVRVEVSIVSPIQAIRVGVGALKPQNYADLIAEDDM